MNNKKNITIEMSDNAATLLRHILNEAKKGCMNNMAVINSIEKKLESQQGKSGDADTIEKLWLVRYSFYCMDSRVFYGSACCWANSKDDARKVLWKNWRNDCTLRIERVDEINGVTRKESVLKGANLFVAKAYDGQEAESSSVNELLFTVSCDVEVAGVRISKHLAKKHPECKFNHFTMLDMASLDIFFFDGMKLALWARMEPRVLIHRNFLDLPDNSEEENDKEQLYIVTLFHRWGRDIGYMNRDGLCRRFDEEVVDAALKIVDLIGVYKDGTIEIKKC